MSRTTSHELAWGLGALAIAHVVYTVPQVILSGQTKDSPAAPPIASVVLAPAAGSTVNSVSMVYESVTDVFYKIPPTEIRPLIST